MTYNVFSGTLNPTQSIEVVCHCLLPVILYNFVFVPLLHFRVCIGAVLTVAV